MTNDLVSIIVPVYNTKEYLERCIESVRHLEYDNWQLILVDDESADGSGQLCDEYAKYDERIMALHQTNQGPAAARQKGLEYAKGKWVMFADSDDWLDTRILTVLMTHQKKTGARMVCCTFVNVNDRNEKQHLPTFSEEYIDCQSAEECMLHMHRTRYLTGSPCTKLIEKELFKDIDFCLEVTIGEDYSMIVQLAQKAKRVRLLSAELYYRYVRKGSISHMGYSKRHKKAFDNYLRVRLELIEQYPALRKDIVGFHTEFEMAVITAMCRNMTFDKEVIGKLKNDLRENMKDTWTNKQIALYMKVCAWLIAYPTYVFIILFRILYLFTGR